MRLEINNLMMGFARHEYPIMISGNAPTPYPMQLFFGLLHICGENSMEIPLRRIFCNGWGMPVSSHILDKDTFCMPTNIDMVWLSVVERKFYSIIQKLPVELMEELFEQTDEETKEPLFEHIVVGMAPYGGVAVWTHGFKKSVMVDWMHGEETHVDMKDFMPMNPDVTLDENCDFYINNDPRVKENLEKNGLPPRDLFDRYMQQFNYRYVVEFGHWDEEKKEWTDYELDEVRPEFEYIEEALYDGTHDKLHDGGLMQYHQAGKPKKLALQYRIKMSAYSAYLWFEDFKIRTAFENFYCEYPEAEMDFLFRIDPEKNIYQILFTCKDAEQPVPLNEEAYQMIVFKSKFERYRTQNYNQPRGAWIW